MDDTRKTVGQGFDVPIRYKANLTIDEAVEYSGISRAGLLKMTINMIVRSFSFRTSQTDKKEGF